jgi:hypothetical protein
VSFGEDDFAKYPTTYFRKTFTKASTVTVTNLALRLCFTDGVAVYLNGTEAFRRHLNQAASFNDLAVASRAEWQNYWLSIPVNPALLRNGTNLVAVELHRLDPMGSDLSFDLQLSEGSVDLPAHFVGLPRLSGGSWRISLAGPAGSLVVIQTSDNLQTWSEAGRVVLVGGVGVFQEPASQNASPRFFRLRN